MNTTRYMTLLLCLAGLLSSGSIFAQTGTTVNSTWVPLDAQNWNDPNNWTNPDFGQYVPDNSIGEGESARIDNGGTAIVDVTVPSVAELAIGGGTVDVQSNGVSTTIADSLGDGSFRIGPIEGAAKISGTGIINAGGNLINRGNFRVTGPNATVSVGGDFINTDTGTLVADLTDANNHTVINVAGAAQLAGTLRVESDDSFSPTFGDSWTLISAGSPISTNFNSVVDGTPSGLPTGLRYKAEISGNTSLLTVDNRLHLTVDRVNNSMTISNLLGAPIDITGYAIRSEGLFSLAGWDSFTDNPGTAGTGWRTANPTGSNLAELNLQSSYSIAVAETLALGTPYLGGNIAPPQENITFTYSTASGELVEGSVEFVGAINDLVLYVDPSTGDAVIGTQSTFVDPFTITGYSIRSESASLTPGLWDSFTSSGEAGTGWREANPTSSTLAELNLENSTVFSFNTGIAIGSVFNTSGVEDLVFQYSTLAGSVATGTVKYGTLPDFSGLPGDFDGDGNVDGNDFLMWQRNPGIGSLADWQATYGNHPLLASSTGVPEPSTLLILLVGAGVTAGQRRDRD